MRTESESEVAQSCLTLCDPMESVAYQAPLFMGFSRQEYCSGLPFPSPDLSNPGIEPVSPALAGGFFIIEPPGKPRIGCIQNIKAPKGEERSLMICVW